MAVIIAWQVPTQTFCTETTLGESTTDRINIRSYLINDDITAIRNQVLADNLTEFGEVWLPGHCIASVIVSKGLICTSREPKRKSVGIGFGIDISPGQKRTDNPVSLAYVKIDVKLWAPVEKSRTPGLGLW